MRYDKYATLSTSHIWVSPMPLFHIWTFFLLFQVFLCSGWKFSVRFIYISHCTSFSTLVHTINMNSDDTLESGRGRGCEEIERKNEIVNQKPFFPRTMMVCYNGNCCQRHTEMEMTVEMECILLWKDICLSRNDDATTRTSRGEEVKTRGPHLKAKRKWKRVRKSIEMLILAVG